MNISYSAAQLEQFRRDAKRLSRKQTIPHNEALDAIALTKGYANWSLLAKHSTSATRKLPAPAPSPMPLAATTSQRSRRAYLHGDQHETDLAHFYCARCDVFFEADHFASHGAHTGDAFLDSLERWNKRDWMSKLSSHRPERTVNILETAALAARAQYQALRRAFSAWLLQQRSRRDSVGMFAYGVVSRRGLPATPKSLPNLRRHYERWGMRRSEGDVLYSAWDEFLNTPSE